MMSLEYLAVPESREELKKKKKKEREREITAYQKNREADE